MRLLPSSIPVPKAGSGFPGPPPGARAAPGRGAVAADVDAVVIAPPHDQLTRIALAAVEAGHHVLVEKPAGRRPSELAPLVAAARKHGRIVKVGFNHRFH